MFGSITGGVTAPEKDKNWENPRVLTDAVLEKLDTILRAVQDIEWHEFKFTVAAKCEKMQIKLAM